MISSSTRLRPWIELLRWNKPSGRLILLVPAGWALWLNPSAPPDPLLVLQIIAGGLAVSGAGCIANDIWDQRFDGHVARTRSRPLAQGSLSRWSALTLLLLLLTVSLGVVLTLPRNSLNICLQLAIAALIPILFYPSAKRWFPFPQAILAMCWGFAVLIPWAAATAALEISLPLLGCWLATLLWTFGFDTVYAMADRRDDAKLGLRSSALTLGQLAVPVVRLCYATSALCIGIAALQAEVAAPFWPFWVLASGLMQLSCRPLSHGETSMAVFGRHFARQVQVGALFWVGLVLAGGWF